ncbi:hypothetical protein [Desulfosporosinus meridiei]|uniref:Uncharacterized protein n=1 Tax=Desulfosporosinus meridiei (strain ATCC BAA-275 / DSM 13257 / KCTC 12902 / NCIMB 13706 / S10) TaxID=768704 RepID=J7J448_DESMD|nr:hypothetical protein [Desulfosporosinus meridiei]AFQ45731.1 hypothetical protein Desmer_3895 [Desulfosporosinus meridiei DSM 13257]
MNLQNRELYQVWSMRLSIGIMIIVLVLSWLNEIKLFDLMIRAAISFGVMYLLMTGTLTLFERTAPQKPEEGEIDPDNGRGANIDFSVGDDEIQAPVGDDEIQAPSGQEAAFPGQVDRKLSSGLPDSERQAEIVKRMGWD